LLLTRPREDPRLVRFTRICLALPEARREVSGRHAGFLVGKKTFAYYLDDHHSDGIVSICGKVAPGANAEMIAADPVRYYMPAYIGPRGWVALRLDVGDVEWEEVATLAVHSYRRVASKRLVALSRTSPR
jgi:phosphoribosylglycinamide formyltransferase-1